MPGPLAHQGLEMLGIGQGLSAHASISPQYRPMAISLTASAKARLKADCSATLESVNT